MNQDSVIISTIISRANARKMIVSVTVFIFHQMLETHPLALSTHQSIWVASAPCWGWRETGRWQKRPEKAAASQNDGEAFYYRESPGVEEGRGRVAAVVIGIYPTMYCFQSAFPTTPPIPPRKK